MRLYRNDHPDSRTQGQFAAAAIPPATDKRNLASASTAIAISPTPSRIIPGK